MRAHMGDGGDGGDTPLLASKNLSPLLEQKNQGPSEKFGPGKGEIEFFEIFSFIFVVF